MKIALVILHADPARGGAERYTIDIAAALARRGHAVSLLATSFGAVPEGVVAVELDAGGATRLGQYRQLLGALDQHLASNAYDVVHAMLPVRRCDLYHPHAGVAAEAVASGHLKHRSSLAASLSQLGTRFNRKRQAFARVERELLTGEKPPVVLCLSDYVKAALRRHYPMPEGRLFKLFNAVDLTRFDPERHRAAGQEVRRRFGLATDDAVALIIAQDFERKGLREAIEAVARVNDARLRLLVVGKDDAAPYARLARQRGVEGRVIFAGGTTDPGSFYAASDFFVLPTRHDPCSLVVLEALAMGLPVISTKQNGACEVMEDGREGFVLQDPADVGALAEAMTRLLDTQTRQAFSRSAIALRGALSQEAHVDRLLDAYALARRGA